MYCTGPDWVTERRERDRKKTNSDDKEDRNDNSNDNNKIIKDKNNDSNVSADREK